MSVLYFNSQTSDDFNINKSYGEAQSGLNPLNIPMKVPRCSLFISISQTARMRGRETGSVGEEAEIYIPISSFENDENRLNLVDIIMYYIKLTFFTKSQNFKNCGQLVSEQEE